LSPRCSLAVVELEKIYSRKIKNLASLRQAVFMIHKLRSISRPAATPLEAIGGLCRFIHRRFFKTVKEELTFRSTEREKREPAPTVVGTSPSANFQRCPASRHRNLPR